MSKTRTRRELKNGPPRPARHDGSRSVNKKGVWLGTSVLAALWIAWFIFGSQGPRLKGLPTLPQTPVDKPTSDPPGTIDGAKNPELVPDEVAYRLLLLATAEPGNPSPAQSARARAKMQAAHLSEDDLNILLAAASEYKSARDSLDAQASDLHAHFPLAHMNPQSVEGQQLARLGQKRDQLLVDTIASLRSELSADGLQRLETQIQNVKRHVKLTLSPDMPF